MILSRFLLRRFSGIFGSSNGREDCFIIFPSNFDRVFFSLSYRSYATARQQLQVDSPSSEVSPTIRSSSRPLFVESSSEISTPLNSEDTPTLGEVRILFTPFFVHPHFLGCPWCRGKQINFIQSTRSLPFPSFASLLHQT